MKEENLRQKQAFEIYYSLGDGRTLEKLREKLKTIPEYSQHIPALITLKSWSKKYNWQSRIQQRDIENSRSLQKQTNNSIIDMKIEIRNLIKVQLALMTKSLNDFLKSKRVTEIKSISDLNALSSTLDRLARLEMDLVGESMLKAEVDVTSDSLQKILLADSNLKEQLLEALEKAKND